LKCEQAADDADGDKLGGGKLVQLTLCLAACPQCPQVASVNFKRKQQHDQEVAARLKVLEGYHQVNGQEGYHQANGQGEDWRSGREALR